MILDFWRCQKLWDLIREPFNNTKKDTISTIISQGLEIEANLYCLIILDIGSALITKVVENLKKAKVSIDVYYYQEDNGSEIFEQKWRRP